MQKSREETIKISRVDEGKFLACAGYPECKYERKIEDKNRRTHL